MFRGRWNTLFAAMFSVVLFPSVVWGVPAFPEQHTPPPRLVPDRPVPPPPASPPALEPHAGEPEQPSASPDADDAPAPPPNSDKTAHPPKEAPEILNNPDALPAPVRQMRQRILDAAISGDAENLRGIIKALPKPPMFTFTDQTAAPDEQEDPITALKKSSFDGEGREVLAILAEVLEARFVHVDKGTPQEMYIWPYYAQYPIDKLTPPQIVELFRIVTAFEFNEMNEFGAYTFYRIGISPDGTWQFLVTGD